jgi:hypothetical protein
MFVITFVQSLYGQTQDSLIVDDEVFENILEDFTDENEDASAADDLEEFIKNPVELNLATIEDLISIPFFDISVANIIIEHRKKFGDFFSVYELRLVQGLSTNFVEKVIPFFKVTKKAPIQKEVSAFDEFIDLTKIDYRSRFQSDIQDRKGFRENKYYGTKLKSYQRLGVKYDKSLSAGMLIEKDPGENSFSDFSNFYIEYVPNKIIEKIIVGDYLVEFGQGLTMWSPYGFSKGAEIVSPLFRKDKNVRVYRSTDENRFKRGSAVVLKYSDLRFTFYYSNNRFDANIDSLTSTIQSRPLDGYHRTDTEMNRKNKGREVILGTRLDYKILPNFEINLMQMRNSLNAELTERSSKYDAQGNTFDYSALAYTYFKGNFYSTGEFSYNGISVASINNIQVKLTNNFILVTSIRNYPRNFYSLQGIGFAEQGSRTQNEFGIYTGFRYRSSIGVFNCYFDQFRFPSASSENIFPSKGNEIMIDYKESLSRMVEINLRYKRELKEVMVASEPSKQVTERLRQNFRSEMIIKPFTKVRLRSRFDIVFFNIKNHFSNERGWLLFQDMRWNATPKMNLTGRIIFFKTDSFNSAVYEYENDLPGIMSNVALYEEGIRWYFILNYSVMKNLKLGVKYSETYKPRKTTLSSGNSEIPGNLDNKINLQFDFIF